MTPNNQLHWTCKRRRCACCLQASELGRLTSGLYAKLKNAGLRRVILRDAFTGQLVPQDPNDEPASELLKRIAAERDGRGAPISRRRRAAS